MFSTIAASYQWWNIYTGIIPGATNSYYIITQPGDYYVIITDTTACQGSSNVITITGVNDIQDNLSLLTIKPNPNTGIFMLRLSPNLAKEDSLRIIDPLGQIVYTCRIMASNQNHNINLTGNAKGIYAVNVIIDGKLFSGRFIVE